MAQAADIIKPSEMEQIKKVMHNMDAPQRRTIQAASYLSVKHALPKTCINHTIIHENPCQDRVLNIELDRIHRRRKGYNSVYEISRRTFLDKQARKQRKWKQQDQMRIASMNFPNLRASAVDGRASVEVIYKSPRYNDAEKATYMGKPLLPYMKLRRETTEFIRSHNKIATTRLPDVVETDSFKLRRYNTFCGADFEKVIKNEKQNDARFEALTDSLSRLKSPPIDEPVRKLKREGNESPDDGTKYWFLDDDVSEGSLLPSRTVSRDSVRKPTVVFPVMTRSQTTSGRSTRRPSLDREMTQYDITLKKNSPDKPRLVAFPEIEQTENISSVAMSAQPTATPASARHSTPQRKVVDPTNPIVTELKDDKKANSPGQVRKGILKSPRKESRIPPEKPEERREKIKQDLQSKDLRELRETYGPLKEVSEPKKDPRDDNSFHSPTLERRFAVKSAKKE